MGLATAAFLLLATASNDPELELAAALARRGWIELAEDLCARIEKSPASSPAARDGVPMVLAEVAIARARVEADVAKASKELEVAVGRLNRPNHALTLDERGMIGWLHVQKAKILTAAAQDDAARRPDAIRSWETAINHYRSSLLEFAKETSNRAVEEATLDATLELAKAQAAQARVPSIDPALRKKLLDDSVRAFSDLLLGLSPQPILIEALLEEGRCRADLQDFVRAERCFREMPRMSAALRKMGFPASEYMTSLLHQGVLALANTLIQAQKPKEAIAACDEFLRVNPRLVRSAVGLAVTLAKADATFAAGDRDGALALAESVLAVDPNGSAGQAAAERIRRWGGTSADPKRILMLADNLIDRGRFRDALVELRRVVEACKTDAERATHEPVAAFKRGECFRALKQDPEASVAFQEVFRKFPRHDLAPRAALEAVLALSRASSDRRDEEQMEKLIDEVTRLPLEGDARSFLNFLRAKILERKGELKASADLFRQVDEACPVYDEALVMASYGYRRDAEQKWERARGPARDDLAKQLAVAESMVRKAVPRLEAGSSRDRSRLLTSAYYELASLALHESSPKPADALGYLRKCAALLPAESEMRPRLAELEIHAHFLAKDLDAAAAGVDRMIREFPDAAPTARACRRLAQRVEATDPARAAKYYGAWLDRTATIPYTTLEVLQVADGLYRVARELNQFGPEVASALDLRGKAPANRAVWADAARAYAMVAPGKGIPEDDAARAARHLVWCAGFQAQTADDWAKAKTLSESLLQAHGALKNGVFVPVVVAGKKWLLGVYLEYGHALVQLGRSGQKFQYGNALTVFNDVLQATPEESESWWISKYMAIRCFFERGEGADIRTASAALSLLESNRPGFDGGKYGLKARFAELQAEVKEALGRQR